MQMLNRLARIGSTVGNDAKPGVRQLKLFGNVGDGTQDMCQQVIIQLTGIQHVGRVQFGNHQHMHRRLWGHVMKCQNAIILVYLL